MDFIQSCSINHPDYIADPLAYFPLHAFLMSPILISWHCNSRKTTLPSRPNRRGLKFSNHSQRKD
ncbi:protein YnhH [Pluralibacter gergoviae]|uniref:protein YnhH n=1 Tax=Pluralibacter gergoviae TaxID=61647 RepID=UPI003EE2F126